MTQAVDRVFQAALALNEDEQLQLVASLVAAVEERGLRPFDDSWLAEIQRRSDEYDAGTATAISWVEVKERARRRIADRG